MESSPVSFHEKKPHATPLNEARELKLMVDSRLKSLLDTPAIQSVQMLADPRANEVATLKYLSTQFDARTHALARAPQDMKASAEAGLREFLDEVRTIFALRKEQGIVISFPTDRRKGV